MTKDNSYTPSCVDCGTQNCKFKDISRILPDDRFGYRRFGVGTGTL